MTFEAPRDRARDRIRDRIRDRSEFDALLKRHPMCVVYFTAPDCAVCQALKPKVKAMLSQRFPRIAFAEVDCASTPDLAALQGIFSLPTLTLYIEGRETLRKVRAFGLGEVAGDLERPYSMLFA